MAHEFMYINKKIAFSLWLLPRFFTTGYNWTFSTKPPYHIQRLSMGESS